MWTRLLLIPTTLTLLAGCSQAPANPPMATNTGVCAALGPYFPIKYHGLSTDAETKGNIQRGNAAVKAACP